MDIEEERDNLYEERRGERKRERNRKGKWKREIGNEGNGIKTKSV